MGQPQYRCLDTPQSLSRKRVFFLPRFFSSIILIIFFLASYPEHAKILADAGLDRAAILQRLFELTEYPTERLGYFAAGFASRIKDETYRCFRSPQDILLLMAGGRLPEKGARDRIKWFNLVRLPMA